MKGDRLLEEELGAGSSCDLRLFAQAAGLGSEGGQTPLKWEIDLRKGIDRGRPGKSPRLLSLSKQGPLS